MSMYDLSAPAMNGQLITDCATSNKTFSATSRSIRVGAGTGTLQLTLVGGQSITFSGMVVGEVLNVRATGSTSAGTTVTNIVVLW